VPRYEKVEGKLIIKDIFVRRKELWGYSIIGARVLKPDGSLATPRDGVSVDMTLAQDFRRVRPSDLPYYRRGGYYIWRFDSRAEGIRSDAATVTVHAKLDELVVDTDSRSVRI
jgi:hypothetical protein